MSNQLQIFIVILFISHENFDGNGGVHGHGLSNPEENRLCGRWYAVMATECSDDGLCNLFTHNKAPCKCISMYLSYLQNNNWEVIISSVNNDTGMLTVDKGGASESAPDSGEICGFVLSRAQMKTSVVSTSNNFLTERVTGSGCFFSYTMSTIAFDGEQGFMVTKVQIDQGQPLIVIWSRRPAPGKATTWTAIVKTLREHKMDPHQYSFIKQDNCIYPSMEQCDEMLFCQ